MPTTQPYQYFKGKICLISSAVLSENIVSLDNWKWWTKTARSKGYLTRPGGNGRPSLIEWAAIPEKYRDEIIAKYGQPEKQRNFLEGFFEMDAAARTTYDAFRFEDGVSLDKEQIERYTVNASVLNALGAAKTYREQMRKRMGGTMKGIRQTLAADVRDFNHVLKAKYNTEHSLPQNEIRLFEKLRKYQAQGYHYLIDRRNRKQNAKKVTPEMVQLWNDMFAGQRHKPTHLEVAFKYNMFLAGKLEVVKLDGTGETYNPSDACFVHVSESSIYGYLSEHKNRIGVFKARSGNRKTYTDSYTPSARMLRPSVGAIISVDDYQPPFKWAEGGGNRMWFYAAQDLGSTAITAWVWGDSKEGIIIDFYRQLVRNYAEWGLCLPYLIECEMALNSSFMNTFLSPGAMFQKVRVYPNKPRAKKIERTIRDLRLQKAAKHPAFVARPDAHDENYQQKPGKQIFLSKDEIVDIELGYIEEWNNEPHPDRDVYPGMTRWQVFMQKQNPALKPINWRGILPYIGHVTRTSMRMGRITLQGIDRVVGINGEVALGETLLNIMNEIEGREVNVHWLDDNNGNVLKAHVYDADGRLICEVLDDLPFHRSELDQTDQCRKNMELYFAYENTVDGHANRIARSINSVELIETEVKPKGDFRIAGLRRNEVKEPAMPEALPELKDDNDTDLIPVETTFKTSTRSRF
jgi:hypothetical protein